MKTTFGIPHGGTNFVYPYINSLIGMCLYEASKPYQTFKVELAKALEEGLISQEYATTIELILKKAEESRLLGSILPHGGPYVDDNRTGIAINHCTQTTDDWALMIDPDIEYPANILDLHREHVKNYPEARIIAGRVNLLNGLPVFYFHTPNANSHYYYPFDGLKEFDLIGTGIIFIHRDVFVKMREVYGHHHFFSRVMVKQMLYGDDFSFCLRAKKAGFKLYGAWDIVGIHHKTYPVPQTYPERAKMEIKVK